jgi:phosphoribosyl 1,2-cyclic phosphodiesterase
LINRYDINHIDGIFATNPKYDHIGGIREFEYWQGELDFLAEENLFQIIEREYWTDRLKTKMFHIPCYPGAPLFFGDFSLLPFAVRRRIPIFGISIREPGGKRIVYTADTPSRLTNYARRLMMEADLLIVNTPTFEPPKEDHITVTEAVELKGMVRAKEMILTYFSHQNRPHDILESFARQLMGVTIAYDGMSVEI